LNLRLQQSNLQGIGLKLGMHSGPALAVNADERLDYFGQSVNIAARIQGLADADEIWLSDEVMAYPGNQELLQNAQWDSEQELAHLKGIGEPIPVWRCIRRPFKE
jgi:class 3 adenylate cyclase